MALKVLPRDTLIWPTIPERIPRQKAYLYVFLILCTALLLYFYSYPLHDEKWPTLRDAKQFIFNRQDQEGVLTPGSPSTSKTDGLIVKLLPRSNEIDTGQNIKRGHSSETTVSTIDSNADLNEKLPTMGVVDESARLSTQVALEEEITELTSTKLIRDVKITEHASAKQFNESTLDGGIAMREQTKLSIQSTVAREIPKSLSIKLPTPPITEETMTLKRTKASTSSVVSNKIAKSVSTDVPTPSAADEYITKPAPTELPTPSLMEKTTTHKPTKASSSVVSEEIIKSVSTELSKSSITDRGITNPEATKVSTESTLGGKITKFVLTTNAIRLSDNSNRIIKYEAARRETTDQELTTSPFQVTEADPISKTKQSVPDGFLVFSKHCRIPDLDPMHPSIRHLIEKVPPLDCSIDYKNLTWTEGDLLHLDRSATNERAGGNKYTCCYKTVYRRRDGHSDSSVGYGENCMQLYNTNTIKDEFIMVECAFLNGTSFYKEFHSFIHDKPEVEKRCNGSTVPKYSVLIIGADAMSRINMHRQLNATARYLLQEMEAVEMYGFNKVGDNTFPNLVPLLVGYDERELPQVCWKYSNMSLDNCNFIWKRYAKEGYRTFYSEDTPHMASFNYVKRGFFNQPTDYYFRNFILAYEDTLGRNKIMNCHQCVGSTSETEAILHWTWRFASHFSHRPYFAFSWINSLTHDFLNMGSSGDHMYHNFFRSLHKTGALNRTIVFLMGDHGMRWGEIRKTFIGRFEERLPMLLIALPQEFKREYPEFANILRQNSHRLTTPFDLHATLQHLLNLQDNEWTLKSGDEINDELSKNFSSRALSLFRTIPEDRSCDDAFIEEHWCTCETSLEADINSQNVNDVGQFLVDNINNMLETISNCAHLTLLSITDARLWQPPSEHKGHSADDNIYTVVVHTEPGEAVFEGTVKISSQENEKKLLGTISRLNLYGNQSVCVDNAIYKKYCFCL